MILRRYGRNVESVDLNFESKALSEIGFRRNRETSIPADEFEAGWEKVEEHALEATSEGPVQDEAEQVLLEDLEGQIRELEAGLDEASVLVVESEQGADYPKVREKRENVIVEGENRFYFRKRVEPPLRIGVYRRKG